MCGLPEVHNAVVPFLDELGLAASQYHIKAAGPLPSRRFLLSFHGAGGLASRKAGKVLANLRNTYQWRTFEADVAGSTPARLHLGPDKNPKQV